MKKLLLLMAAAAVIFSCGKEKQPEDNNEEPEEVQEEETIEVTSITLRKTNIEMDITLTEGKIIEVISTTPSVNEDYLNAEIITGDDVISLERDERGWRAKPKKLGTAKVKITPSHGTALVSCTVKVSEGDVADANPITKLSCEKTSFTLKDLDDSGFSIGPDKVTIPFDIEPAEAVFGSDINVEVDREDVLTVQTEGHNLTISAQPNLSDKPSETGTFHVYVKPKKGSAKPVTLKVEVTGHIYDIKLGLFDSENVHWRMDSDNNKVIVLVIGDKVDLKPKVLATDRRKWDLAENVDMFLSNGKDNMGRWKQAGKEYGTVSPQGIIEPGEYVSESLAEEIRLILATKNSGIEKRSYLVKIYSKITDFSIDSEPNVSNNYPLVGDEFTLTMENWPPIGFTREEFEIVYPSSYLSLVKEEVGKFTFKCTECTVDTKISIRVYPIGREDLKKYYEFHINKFAPSDRKIGDFVYWNSSMGFYASDGGLRAYDSDYRKFRQDKTTPFEDNLIGVILRELSSEEMEEIKAVDPGITYAGINKKHYKILSAGMAGKTAWGATQVPWEDIANVWQSKLGWKYGNAPYRRAVDRKDYADEIQITRGWVAYNGVVATTPAKMMMAVMPLGQFGESSSTYVQTTRPIDKTACSGWVLPLVFHSGIHNSIAYQALRNSGVSASDLESDCWFSAFTEGETDDGKTIYQAIAFSYSKGNYYALRSAEKYIWPYLYL